MALAASRPVDSPFWLVAAAFRAAFLVCPVAFLLAGLPACIDSSMDVVHCLYVCHSSVILFYFDFVF